MKKNLAVLLLRMDGAEDLPTKDYADQLFTSVGRGTGNLLDYYDDMSHGRLDLSGSRVYNWINYGHTNDDLQTEWNNAKDKKKKELKDAGIAEKEAENKSNEYANAIRRGKIVEWAREAAKRNQLSIDSSDILICVFNQPVDYFGSPGYAVLNWNAADLGCFSIDLTGVSHEVGHALGLASHSRMQGYEEEYGDQWDIMSAYKVLHFDRSGDSIPPGSPYFTYGPGLNAVNMDLVGWLDSSRVFSGRGSPGYSFRLRPLHRRDLPGWLAAKISIGYETFYFEFRMDDRWDVAFAKPCILIHKQSVHPGDGRPCSEIIVAQPDASSGPRADLRDGEMFEIGDRLNLFDLFVQIKVREINTVTQEAWVDVKVREYRMFEPGAGITFGGVTVDGGGYIWVPGRGLVKVPPRSPILTVIERLAEVEILQTLDRGERGPDIDQLSLSRLIDARDALSGLIEARQAPQVPGRLMSHDQTKSD